MNSIAIGYLEFLLANFAQKCGVIIYHDSELGPLEKIEENYVNLLENSTGPINRI
jgi:hypothetical protein